MPIERRLDQETLDPDDLDELRALGHRMLDDMFDRVQEMRERPVWQPIPQSARRAMEAPLPLHPVRGDDTIDVSLLWEAISRDLAAGCRPTCIVANAGATNTGVIDPLNDLAEIAEANGMWFHVDGAFGALAAFSPELKPLLAGMERADSLAFDLHKWGYQPFEVGCTLVSHRAAQIGAFTLTPDYLTHGERGTAGASLWFSDHGIQLTRGFRALKVWMAFKAHGVEKIGRVIRQNVEQARYLADLVTDSPYLELVAQVPLNVVCFRFAHPQLDEEATNALNAELLIRIQEAGIAVPSGMRVRGRYALRCAITNHRSRWEDFELLAQAAEEIGQAILADTVPGEAATR